jgi:hypothetical protein
MNRTKINRKTNIELKKIFQNYVYECEARLSGCMNYQLTFAHRHKRYWYYDKPDQLLWDMNQVVLACINCHSKMEQNKKLTEEVFLKLRGIENEI